MVRAARAYPHALPAGLLMRDLAERYERAARLLPWNLRGSVRNARVEPHWIGDSDLFWYRRQTSEGHEFRLVDPDAGSNEPAFDHEAMAAELAGALGGAVSPLLLPFGSLEWTRPDDPFRVEAGGRRFAFDGGKLVEEAAAPAPAPCELLSPDGRWAAFRRGPDLWVRETATGREKPLTKDGIDGYAYAGTSGTDCHPVTRMLNPGHQLPRAIWSSDSRRLITQRIDERRVAPFHLLETVPADASRRPRLHSYPYSIPQDAEVAQVEILFIDVASGRMATCDRGPRHGAYITPIDRGFVWWGAGDRKAYWLDFERGHRSVTLCEIDPGTGASTRIIREQADSYVELNLDMSRPPNVRDLFDGEQFLWMSERDGWAHLYLIDRDGNVLAQIGSGEWTVRDIVRVDERKGELWFTANGREPGRDPYYRRLYRTCLDGTRITLMTTEDADHEILSSPEFFCMAPMRGGQAAPPASLSPSGRWLVSTHSTADSAPVSVLRSTAQPDAPTIVERCDVSQLLSRGWKWPEPFEALAADGRSPVHGALFLPSDFDPHRSYPVLDFVYPGPQSIQTPKSSFNADPMRFFVYATAQAQAELGFAVVTIDGRGTPFRSKSWHDAGYGRLQDAGGTEDRLSAIAQLAKERPWLDTGRLGTFGHSGGGYAATRAILQHPDRFVAAYASCPVQDMGCYISDWGEKYQGPFEPDRYAAQDNAGLAHRLKGKLMLVWGAMDDNVHMVGNHRLIQALIDAGKSFEMLEIPTGNHWFALYMGYPHRRQWDFFARHLLQIVPPPDMIIGDDPDFPPERRPPRPPTGWAAAPPS